MKNVGAVLFFNAMCLPPLLEFSRGVTCGWICSPLFPSLTLLFGRRDSSNFLLLPCEGQRDVPLSYCQNGSAVKFLLTGIDVPFSFPPFTHINPLPFTGLTPAQSGRFPQYDRRIFFLPFYAYNVVAKIPHFPLCLISPLVHSTPYDLFMVCSLLLPCPPCVTPPTPTISCRL